jgi:hypothetical protein
MENVRHFGEVKFERDPEIVRKIVGSPWYKDFDIISEDIVMLECVCKTVYLNRPIYGGMKILDISKFHMFDIWYNLLKPEFGTNLKLIMTDTDSLQFTVLGMTEGEYNNKVLTTESLRNYLDFSKFPKAHPLYTDKNTEVGKMKSEREGKTINYAVALRAKCYFTDMSELREEYKQKEVKEKDKKKVKKQEGQQEIKKVKGVTKPVKETMLMGEHYVTSLLANKKVTVHNQTRIQCKNRLMYTIQESKLALSADDTKRYITDNIIRTRAIGHYLNRLPINE